MKVKKKILEEITIKLTGSETTQLVHLLNGLADKSQFAEQLRDRLRDTF